MKTQSFFYLGKDYVAVRKQYNGLSAGFQEGAARLTNKP
jgi:hypothetical protein